MTGSSSLHAAHLMLRVLPRVPAKREEALGNPRSRGRYLPVPSRLSASSTHGRARSQRVGASGQTRHHFPERWDCAYTRLQAKRTYHLSRPDLDAVAAGLGPVVPPPPPHSVEAWGLWVPRSPVARELGAQVQGLLQGWSRAEGLLAGP